MGKHEYGCEVYENQTGSPNLMKYSILDENAGGEMRINSIIFKVHVDPIIYVFMTIESRIQ